MIDAEQNWIPVSEKKPKLLKRVLICSKNGRFHLGFYEGFGIWEIDGIKCGQYDFGELAWMPLPEPWKGGKE